MYNELKNRAEDALNAMCKALNIDSLCRAISFEYDVKLVHYYANKKFLTFNHLIASNTYLFVHKLHGVLLKLPKKINLKILRKLIDKHIQKYCLVDTECYYKLP
jgi:hypothetical protein